MKRGKAAFNALLYQLKRHANKRGIAWDMTSKQVQHITKLDCAYCGSPPAQSKNHPHYNGEYVYNGMDRVDNGEGYTLDNVVSCCGVCNRMKGTMAADDFVAHIEKIKVYLVKNEIKSRQTLSDAL